MTLLIFKRSFWSLGGEPLWRVCLMGVAALAFFGFFAFEALALLIPTQAGRITKFVDLVFARAPPPPMTKAQSDWFDAVQVENHRRRLCEDLSKLRSALNDLREEEAWIDKEAAKEASAAMQRGLAFLEQDRNSFAACVEAVSPMPAPPPD